VLAAIRKNYKLVVNTESISLPFRPESWNWTLWVDRMQESTHVTCRSELVLPYKRSSQFKLKVSLLFSWI